MPDPPKKCSCSLVYEPIKRERKLCDEAYWESEATGPYREDALNRESAHAFSLPLQPKQAWCDSRLSRASSRLLGVHRLSRGDH